MLLSHLRCAAAITSSTLNLWGVFWGQAREGEGCRCGEVHEEGLEDDGTRQEKCSGICLPLTAAALQPHAQHP